MRTESRERIVLGLDPGSRLTGWGAVAVDADRLRHLGSGAIRSNSRQSLPQRLGHIHSEITSVIKAIQPSEIAVEQVFMAPKMAKAALVLGHVRGVLLLAAAQHTDQVYEYAPRQIKQAIVGTGAAAKDQIQFMIGRLLGLSDALQEDQADALAAAICHAHTHVPGRSALVGGVR
ncbi:MAG: crossover junction endodeoxyribonuclease RuvC [Gammaproteobacteria bacterium AqS3]|nr:crossover junction endodeoxyribonuclease RuvC [Gammaproteobacteria bacterium AqS3]